MAVATVGSQQFAGLVDSSCRLVRHVIEVDTDITGITLILQDVFLDVFPRLATIHTTELLFPGNGIGLIVNDGEGLAEGFDGNTGGCRRFGGGT